MATDDCNADVLANSLFTSLVADSPAAPVVDLSGAAYSFTVDTSSQLYTTPSDLTLDELTAGSLSGSGVFDKLMASADLHIEREFKSGRLTGDQYAEVYTTIMATVLNQSTQFLLNRDQSKWASIAAQMKARVAEISATEALVNLEKSKVETQGAIFAMKNSGATYALTKMQVANEDAKHCLIVSQTASENYKVTYILPTERAIQEYTRSTVLPGQVAVTNINATRILPAEAAIKEYQNTVLQPIEKGIQEFQLDNTLPLQQLSAQYGYDNLLPVQLGKEQHLLSYQLPAQTALINEQKEAQHSQTSDTRSDGATAVTGLVGRQASLLSEQREGERAKTMDTRVDGTTVIVGSVGKQKDLYTQQIDSFVKDSKHKAAKMWLDGWTVQKTLDENLAAPTELGVTSVSAVLAKIKTENGLD